MKMQRISNLVLKFSVVAGLITGWSSCLKNNAGQTTPAATQTYISVMNFAYSAPPAELYLNTTKVTNSISPGLYFPSYSNAAAGSYEMIFKKAGADSLLASIPSALYDTSQYNTLILYSDTNGIAKAFRVIDDYSLLTNGTSFFRFFSMSTEVPRADLYIGSSKVASFRTMADNATNNTYNQFSSFTSGTYTVQAKLTGSDSVLATITSLNLIQGSAYTIFLHGKSGIGNPGLKLEALRAN